MSFWASYVLLKEKQGVLREISLVKIALKFGEPVRQEIEAELAQEDAV